MKSDSLSFFEKLEKKCEENNKSSIESFMKFITEIDGNFSIAFTDLKEQILLISSNCFLKVSPKILANNGGTVLPT